MNSSMTSTRTLIIGALIGLVGVSGYLLWALVDERRGGTAGTVISRQIGEQIGGDFTLTDQNGRTVTRQSFAGKPLAVFFGYTHCPDACPTTLTDMTERLSALGADGDKFNVLFVSIDPARDTIALLKSYMESFDPRIVAATGTPEQIADISKKYRVFARKVGEGDSYTLDHSTAVYVFNARGDLVTLIDYHASREEALERMRRALS